MKWSPDWGVRWDEWRARTEKMTYAEQQAFYDDVARDFPEQAHFVREVAIRELTGAAPAGVLEIGGWRGDLAAAVLADPRSAAIRKWVNMDIAPSLAGMQRCRDPRYSFVVAPTWVWDTAIPDEYDAVVATHLIEHLTERQLETLLRRLAKLGRARTLYLESPLREDSHGWKGYRGSHILGLGWAGVRRMVQAAGWTATEQVTPIIIVGRRTR